MGGLVINAPARIALSRATAPACGPNSIPWIARINGTHSRFGLDRRFCSRDDSGATSRLRQGTHTFRIPGPGLYEYRGFRFDDHKDGFALVHHDGTVEAVSRQNARRIARVLDEDQAWYPSGEPDTELIRDQAFSADHRQMAGMR